VVEALAPPSRTPTMNAAAYMLDPMYAVLSAEGYYEVPEVGLEMKNEVKVDLILRVVGVTAEDIFSMLVLQGWPQALTRDMRATVEGLASSKRTGGYNPRPNAAHACAARALGERGCRDRAGAADIRCAPCAERARHDCSHRAGLERVGQAV
jgi:hypothetical protein